MSEVRQARVTVSRGVRCIARCGPTVGLKTGLIFKASYGTSRTWNFGLDLNETVGGGADTGTLETDLSKLVRGRRGFHRSVYSGFHSAAARAVIDRCDLRDRRPRAFQQRSQSGGGGI